MDTKMLHSFPRRHALSSSTVLLPTLMLVIFSPGCIFLPALLGMAATNANWPTEKATAENPVISGRPLTIGFVSDSACDAPFTGGGTEVSIEGDLLCFKRRDLIQTDENELVPAPGPMIHAATLEIVTEQGRSKNIELPEAPASYLTQCPVGSQDAKVWAAERRACVKNTVLVRDTQTVTVQQIINGGWVPLIEWTVAAPAAASSTAQSE